MSWFSKKRVYLDLAAGIEGNPSSPHEEGRQARAALSTARVQLARLTEVKADDIIFTSGATEANALAILGMRGFVNPSSDEGFTKPPHALCLPSAHASIVENMRMVAERGVVVEELSIKNGRIDVDALQKMLRPETVLIAMDAVCGETGTIWNTREVQQVIKDTETYLHVDASQAPFTEKISRAHFDADLLTFDGAKLGVRGTGVLIAHRTIPLKPLYGGGGQERGLRSGTENVEAIGQFARALGAAVENRERFYARAQSARAILISAISGIPDLVVNAGAETVPNILNISLLGRDTDYLVMLLDHAGFAVSTKSACETNSPHGSRAVLALTGDIARAKSTLRISWSFSTTTTELARFAQALTEAVHFLDTSKGAIL
jgi:cysteine desulfurase